MEFKYKKLMEENDLALNQIPEDAKTGIDEINKVLRGITMRERAGTPKARVLPLPVRARPHTSWPFMATGMASV